MLSDYVPTTASGIDMLAKAKARQPEFWAKLRGDLLPHVESIFERLNDDDFCVLTLTEAEILTIQTAFLWLWTQLAIDHAEARMTAGQTANLN